MEGETGAFKCLTRSTSSPARTRSGALVCRPLGTTGRPEFQHEAERTPKQGGLEPPCWLGQVSQTLNHTVSLCACFHRRARSCRSDSHRTFLARTRNRGRLCGTAHCSTVHGIEVVQYRPRRHPVLCTHLEPDSAPVLQRPSHQRIPGQPMLL